MDIFEKRRSIRKFTEQPVTDENLRDLIGAARLAPSGRHFQPWNFIVVRSAEMKEKVAHMEHDQMWIAEAPVLIVCVADGKTRLKEEGIVFSETTPYKEQKLVLRDATIAAEHIVLKAAEMGMGSCWTGLFTQGDARELFSIPSDQHVVGILAIGWPHHEYEIKVKERRAVEDMVMKETWGEKYFG